MKKFYDRRKMLHYAASNDWDGEEWLTYTNMSVRGKDVYSYATKVAEINRKKETLLVTLHTYSMTTSNQISELSRAFDHYKFVYTYDFTVEDAWNRVKATVKEYTEDMLSKKDNREYIDRVYNELEQLVEVFNKGKKYLNSATYNKLSELNEKAKEIENHKIDLLHERRRKAEEKRLAEDERLTDNTLTVLKTLRPEILDTAITYKDLVNRIKIEIDYKKFCEAFPNMSVDRDTFFFKPCDRDCITLSYYYVPRVIGDIKRSVSTREIHKYGDNYSCEPDYLAYYQGLKMFKTSQSCEVDNSTGIVGKKLETLIRMIDKGESEQAINDLFVGKHCGPFDIRGWNSKERFLRVGCHCFLEENLRECLQDLKKGE